MATSLLVFVGALVLAALAVSPAAAQNATAAHFWKPLLPSVKSTRTLTLYTGSEDFIDALGGPQENAGFIGLYQFYVRCGSTSGPVVGVCAETGPYLAKPSDPNARSYQNLAWTCELTATCNGWGLGIISGGGKAPAGDWTPFYPVTLNVYGGTGSFEGIVGGKATYSATKAAFIFYYARY